MLWVDFTDGLTGFTLTLPSLIHPATFPCKRPLPFRVGPFPSPCVTRIQRFARAILLNIGSDFPEEVNAAEGQPITAFDVVQARRVLYEIGGGNADISPAWGNIPRYYMTLVERLRGS